MTSASCRRRLFAAQVDFTYAGDLKVFVDEEQVEALEQRMAERGYLESKSMATVFNLLRSNDLIWPYVINNYLKGKAPFPFDLLYWNSDATRMPAANHSFYLRNCYLDNKLSKGKMTLGDTPIDLKSVKVPIYNLATREDHIAPAKSVLLGCKFFGGDGADSCSPAPATSPAWSTRPAKHKYQFWTGRGRATPTSRAGSPRPRSIPARGGRIGSSGSSARSPTEVPRARSRRRRAQRRSRTRRGAT